MQRISSTLSSLGWLSMRANSTPKSSFLCQPTVVAFEGTNQRRTMISGFVENKVDFDFEKKIRFGWRPGDVDLPVREVLDRYYRLNNGQWIHAMPRRYRYPNENHYYSYPKRLLLLFN